MKVVMLLHKTAEHDSRVLREAAALAQAGHLVTIVHQPSGPSVPVDLPSGVRLVPARRRGVSPLPLGLHRPLVAASLIRRCMAERPDAVHAHDVAMLGPGWIASRLRRSRLVYDTHELATGVAYRSGAWSLLVRAIERLLIRSADAVVTVSAGIAERLRERYRLESRPAMVRNACDLPPPRTGGAPNLPERIGAGDEPLILHQGAIGPGRGADVLVAAVARLDRGRLVFLGAIAEGKPESAEVRSLRELAARLGVADRIHLLPPAPLPALLSYTGQANVGVSLLQDTCENHRLALPNKVFEYLAAGVPVVASALPELESLLAETGAGRTAEGSDPAAVAAAIDEVLSDEDVLRGRAAEAGRRLRWDRERDRLIEVYLGLAADSAPSTGPTAVVLVRNTASHDARTLRVARSLRAEGERVAVVAVTSSDEALREEDVEGIRVLRLGPRLPFAGLRARRDSAWHSAPAARAATAPARKPSPPERVARLLTTLSYYRRAIGTLRRWRPRIVHCNDYNTMWVGVAAKLLWGAAIVYDSHELWPDRNGRSEPRPWLLACEAVFVRVADEVLTTSPGHADAIAARYRRPVPRVVRNLPERSSNGADAADLERDTIVYAGAITSGRGLEQAIEALPHAPGVKLLVLGPGREPSRRALVDLAEMSGVESRVTFAPPVAPASVVASIAGAAAGLALIQPVCRSYELALPNKVFEYLAAGLPVLASDLPVIGPLVSGSNLGLVVPPGDPETIARAMLKLTDPVRNEELRRSVAEARGELSWESERERLTEAHRAALAAAGA